MRSRVEPNQGLASVDRDSGIGQSVEHSLQV
jgi:hypothetical protein